MGFVRVLCRTKACLLAAAGLQTSGFYVAEVVSLALRPGSMR
jgi:hypothetical protein